MRKRRHWKTSKTNMNYRVYLRKNYAYVECVKCSNIEEVEIVLENALEYDEYLIIQHDIKLNMDIPFERGQIQKPINKRLVKKNGDM